MIQQEFDSNSHFSDIVLSFESNLIWSNRNLTRIVTFLTRFRVKLDQIYGNGLISIHLWILTSVGLLHLHVEPINWIFTVGKEVWWRGFNNIGGRHTLYRINIIIITIILSFVNYLSSCPRENDGNGTWPPRAA